MYMAAREHQLLLYNGEHGACVDIVSQETHPRSEKHLSQTHEIFALMIYVWVNLESARDWDTERFYYLYCVTSGDEESVYF